MPALDSISQMHGLAQVVDSSMTGYERSRLTRVGTASSIREGQIRGSAVSGFPDGPGARGWHPGGWMVSMSDLVARLKTLAIEA